MIEPGNDIASKAWQKRNMKLTFPGIMTWWAPVVCMFALQDAWKGASAIFVAIGIWRSRPGWRRWVGAAWLIAMLIWGRKFSEAINGLGVLPDNLFLFWLGGGVCTAWADGQEYKRALLRHGREWR